MSIGAKLVRLYFMYLEVILRSTMQLIIKVRHILCTGCLARYSVDKPVWTGNSGEVSPFAGATEALQTCTGSSGVDRAVGG